MQSMRPPFLGEIESTFNVFQLLVKSYSHDSCATLWNSSLNGSRKNPPLMVLTPSHGGRNIGDAALPRLYCS